MAVILLTNDDGISAPGLVACEAALQGLGTIFVVAPDRERSAVSHGLTIRTPLELQKHSDGHYSLTGTPADCVLYALQHVLFPPPDLIVSGINHGANLGDDIMYSGTVAAAREGSRHGIVSMAVSQAYGDRPVRFSNGLPYLNRLAKALLERSCDPGLCLNVNVPIRRIRGVKITRQGTATHFPHFNPVIGERSDEGLPDLPEIASRSDVPTDYEAVSEQYISITPLQRDQTDYASLRSLGDCVSKTFQRPRLAGLGLIGRMI